MSEEPDDNDEPALDESAGSADWRDWLDRFFREHHVRLVKAARRRTSCREEAQEAVQDAYAQLIERGGLKTPKYLRHMMIRSAINRALDLLRRRRHREKYLVSSRHQRVPDAHSIENQVVARDSLHRLPNFFEELPERYRDAVVMRRFDNIKRQEVARRLCVTTRTVNRYVNQALAYCRYRLEGHSETTAKERAKL